MLTLADPKIRRIPLIDNGERLIPLDGLNARIVVDSSKENADALGYELCFYVRETVGHKLVEAVLQTPDNYAFLIKESLRPQNLQALWFGDYLLSIVEANPELSEGDAVALAARFVAPPSVAGHPTGGAVDLTLCDLRGYELDLGCAYDQDEKTSNGACLSHFDQLSVAHFGQVGFARRRELEAARRAFEQRRANGIFKVLNLPGNRRLRHVQLLRSRADASQLGDGNEISEMPESHGNMSPGRECGMLNHCPGGTVMECQSA
ncbi:hypothetical protein B0G76_3754 [Paraburkholderia sp. BL23I1N1]|nr:hypothetical protein B0G76_3754 [Paraburkholderia sp. BL23I1N1]